MKKTTKSGSGPFQGRGRGSGGARRPGGKPAGSPGFAARRPDAGADGQRPAASSGSPEKRIATSGRTLDIVRKHGFTFKKSLGQNFLIDGTVLDRIIAAAGLDKERGALEIGPGIGALTERLAQAAGRVAAVEIDRRLIPILEEALAPYGNVNVIEADVLKADLAQLWREQFADCRGVSVVANLPYYVTTPIIMKLLEERLPLDSITVMVQKEVAARMSAPPGGKDYGSLSIAVQYYCETKLVCVVPGGAFIPPPNVESAVIHLRRRPQPAVAVADEAAYFRVVQAAFAQRRKTLANNLSVFPGKERKAELAELLQRAGIEPERRAETLSLAEFAVVCEALEQAGMLAAGTGPAAATGTKSAPEERSP